MAGDPDWSPDGEWIVYSTYPLGEFNFVPAISNLYRLRPDGTGTEQLTFDAAGDAAGDAAALHARRRVHRLHRRGARWTRDLAHARRRW